MHDSRWKKIVEHLKAKYEVLEHVTPQPVEGEGCLLKETIVLRGSRGTTKFERITRVAVAEDPLNTSAPEDWLYSEKAISSFIRGFRLNETNQAWEEFDTRDLFFKE